MRTTRVLRWTFTLLALQGCSSDSDSPSGDLDLAANRDKHGRLEPEGTGSEHYLRAEFDLFFASQAQMDAYYQSRSKSNKATGTSLGGGPALTWQRNGDALDIRYCVSSTFANAAQARADIADAARAWESVANVRFRYIAAQDGNCTNAANSNVDVRFFPDATISGACATPPFLPPGAAWCPFALGTLAMKYDSFSPPLYPNITNVGVLRHALGHMLGLRHEDTGNRSGCAQEAPPDDAGVYLTAYDPSSVMRYPGCGGNNNTSFNLSPLDGEGMRQLYGMPAAWYATVL